MNKPSLLFLMLDHASDTYSSLYELGAENNWAEYLGPNFKRYRGLSQKYPFSTSLNRIQISKIGLAAWRKSFAARELRKKRLPNVEEADFGLKVKINDSWWNHGLKTLAAINYSLTHFPFDFLIRGNASTFVNVENLERLIIEHKFDYAGPIEKGKDFVSGWGIVLSRDAATKLMQANYQPFSRFFDDEAIGFVLKEEGIPPLELPSLWIRDKVSMQKMGKEMVKDFAFIRTKSLNHQGARMDSQLMQMIYAKLKE